VFIVVVYFVIDLCPETFGYTIVDGSFFFFFFFFTFDIWNAVAPLPVTT
jgi:hypothetical protein